VLLNPVLTKIDASIGDRITVVGKIAEIKIEDGCENVIVPQFIVNNTPRSNEASSASSKITESVRSQRADDIKVETGNDTDVTIEEIDEQ
jgi:uncharacterized protein YqgV (UPF0045/DUF77 family)